jgi:hypothetical protein
MISQRNEMRLTRLATDITSCEKLTLPPALTLSIGKSFSQSDFFTRITQSEFSYKIHSGCCILSNYVTKLFLFFLLNNKTEATESIPMGTGGMKVFCSQPCIPLYSSSISFRFAS